jgi:type IV pilus assembly protein PilX
MTFRGTTGAAGQRGAILVISLLLLLVLTMLAITMMNMSFNQERMAGNARNINTAFQAAEAGLRDDEQWLASRTTRPDACVGAPCDVYDRAGMPGIAAAAPDLRDMTDAWWSVNGREYGALTGSPAIEGVARPPDTVIENYAFVPDSLTVGAGPPTGRDFFKITSRGTGGVEAAQAVVESTFTRRF